MQPKSQVIDSFNHVNSNPRSQDTRVTKTEDELRSLGKRSLNFASLKLTDDFPSRPGYGTKGSKVELTANYVELIPPSNMILHRYDVQINPEAAGRKRFRIIQLLLQSTELQLHRGDIATDFRSTLVSRTRFPIDDTMVEMGYRNEGEDEPAARATVYKVRILYIKTLNVGELTDYLNSTSLEQIFPDKQELIQALNIFLNHHAKSASNLVTIGSIKSFALDGNLQREELGSGLEVIRGFFSSVRTATCRVLVNINISHGAFYQAGPLPILMNNYGVNNTLALEKFLRLIRVQTTHLPVKRNKAKEVIPRVKTIFGLARKDDGHGMAHPPRVRQHGSGAKDVEFWLNSTATPSGAPKVESKRDTKGKGKAEEKTKKGDSATNGRGRYISVFDFFETGTLLSLSPFKKY